MTNDSKGRSGWHRATLRTTCRRRRRRSNPRLTWRRLQFSERRVRVAAMIRRLAVWGLLPVVAADWVLRRISGEQR